MAKYIITFSYNNLLFKANLRSDLAFIACCLTFDIYPVFFLMVFLLLFDIRYFLFSIRYSIIFRLWGFILTRRGMGVILNT